MNTIRNMIKWTLPRDALLSNNIKNNIHMIIYISQIYFLHVMRENNRLPKSQANLTTLLPKGTIRINGRFSHHPIP
jgi:hypothetical protein